MRRLYEGERFWTDVAHANKRGHMKYNLRTLPVGLEHRRNQAQAWLNENPTIDEGFLEDEFLAEHFTGIHVPHGQLYSGLWADDVHLFFRVDYPNGFPFLWINENSKAFRIRTGSLKVLIPITGIAMGYNTMFYALNKATRNRIGWGRLVPFDRYAARHLLMAVEQAASELRIQDAVYGLMELMQAPTSHEVLDYMEPGDNRYDATKTYTETPIWGEYQITP